MKLGLIARMDDTGLGYQTRDIFNHLSPLKTLVIDSSPFRRDDKGKPLPQHREWYEGKRGVKFLRGFQNPQTMRWITSGVDVVLSCEIFYGYEMVNIARRRGVKTVLQYNAEFLDYFEHPDYPYPDVLLAPTPWMVSAVKEFVGDRSRVEHLPLPIDLSHFNHRTRMNGRRFIHIAGMKTHMDRNGTDIVIEAMKLIPENCVLTIFTQHELSHVEDPRIQVITDCKNNAAMYEAGDVMVLPRRYAGLCLPLNEAIASGVIPLMTDCSPQNEFLAPANLFDGPNEETVFYGRCTIPVSSASPMSVSRKMREMIEADERYVAHLSTQAHNLAKSWSWETLLPEYIKLLENI